MSESPLSEDVRVRTEEPPVHPDAVDRYRRRVRLLPSIRELWSSREMVRSLAERELRARYKQTFLGFAWALITPLALMVVFTVFFRRIADINTGGAPYALFAYLGLLPWGFFSTSVSQGGVSLIFNVPLLNKVRCPREVFPISSVVVAMVDTLIAVSALAALFAINGFAPKWTSIWLPVLWAVEVAFTLGVVLVISSAVVYFRDLRSTLPLLLQLGLFATPVAYGLDKVKGSLRPLYVMINPTAEVIDGARRAVLLGEAPHFGLLGLSALSSFALLAVGYLMFKRLETGIADVA